MPTAIVEVLAGAPHARVTIPENGIEIGRDPRAGLVLLAPSVSKRHLRLFFIGDDLYAHDLSANGTRYDGALLESPTRLVDGAELVLGRSVLLRVTIRNAAFGMATTALLGPAEVVDPVVDAASMSPPKTPVLDVRAVLAPLYEASDLDDLSRRLVDRTRTALVASRVALLELDGTGERARALAVAAQGHAPAAPLDESDVAFVSRTVLAAAVAKGVAYYRNQGPAGERHLVSFTAAQTSAAASAPIVARDGRTRVLYADTMEGAPLLLYGDALALQALAAHAASALNTILAREEIALHRRRFEHLRRYFSPAVVDVLLEAGEDPIRRPRELEATVLFADLRGYTAMAERLRNEVDRFFALLNEWLDIGARAVLSENGTLDKFIGDAVMAVFGAPLPIDEAPLAAVRAALRMREGLAEVASRTGEPLSLTIGINSGPVLAGSVGSERRLEFTVLGDTVNVAARLQANAGTDEILISESTRAALGDAVETERVGELALKNRERAVETYRVLRLRPC